MPIVLWEDCILTTVYLINRTPIAVLHDKSPFGVLFGTPRLYDQLRVFGSLCYANVVPQSSDKFAARAIKGVFIGYPYAKKAYKVLSLETKQVFVSRDVKFIENIFPLKDIQPQAPSLLFPSSHQFIDDDPLRVSPAESDQSAERFCR